MCVGGGGGGGGERERERRDALEVKNGGNCYFSYMYLLITNDSLC